MARRKRFDFVGLAVGAAIALIPELFTPIERIGILVVTIAISFAIYRHYRSEDEDDDGDGGMIDLHLTASAVEPGGPTFLTAQVQDWKSRLLHEFAGHADIYGELKYHEPVPEVGGDFVLTAEQKREAARMADRLRREGKTVHMQLVLSGECEEWKPERYCIPEKADWHTDPVVLPANKIQYSAVRALRKDGYCVPVLSANAVLVCPERRVIVLQRRSQQMDTFEANIHTVGGGYQHDYPGDGELIETATREVYEELKLQIKFSRFLPKVTLGELSTGFIQVNYLGVRVLPTQIDQMAPKTLEGVNYTVSYDALENELKKPGWVPTGKLAIFVWLAFGAPESATDGESARFGDKTAAQLFDALVPAADAMPKAASAKM